MSTETFEATRIRRAPTPPAYCASCYGQYPDRTHVDFGAAYDGPVLEGVAGGVPATIDDLILCEECVGAAAQVVGFGKVAELTDQLANQAERIQELTERLAGAMTYANKLESAISSKPEPVKRGARK